ncbi:unnamed protein product, partial [Nesidiocoris tenuis]
GKIVKKSVLLDRAIEVSGNVRELQTRLERQTGTTADSVREELRQMIESLTEARLTCELTRKLLDIDNEFVAAFADRNVQRYLSAAKHIKNVKELVTAERMNIEFATIFDALVQKYSINHDKFSSETLKLWKNEVSWVVFQLDPSRKSTRLQVNRNKDTLEDLIQTLNVFEICEPRVYAFAQSFKNDVLTPCIVDKISVTSSSSAEHYVLSVSSVTEDKPNVVQVIENLTVAFEFIYNHLDLKIDEERRFISELGALLADNFLSNLVSQSLSEAIPTKRQELPNYEALARKIIDFNNLLKNINFLPADCDKLVKFCGNVEEQFLDKTIERYLSTAREISKLKLHDITTVNSDPVEGSESREFDNAKVKKETSVPFSEIPEDFGQFPACQLSKSVLDLMTLVRQILDNVASSEHPIPNTPVRLFCTARDCINLYVELIPVIHFKLLESLPQEAALFHNNCFYIAHELITLNEPYRAKYNDQVVKIMGSFVDLVSYVRAQGLKVMEFQVSKQNDTIMGIISRSSLNSLAEDVVSSSLEKSLRQCVHQLSFLESMWVTVLPSHVYNRIMGQLCNSFLDEVIGQVCSNKDIKESAATHLARIFGYVQECLPKLFEEPLEVHRHVKKWYKFLELIRILDGSLIEIGDRWADGKGPLAIEFTAEQVRHLIKALFQVSDRRSAVLSRIK